MLERHSMELYGPDPVWRPVFERFGIKTPAELAAFNRTMYREIRDKAIRRIYHELKAMSGPIANGRVLREKLAELFCLSQDRIDQIIYRKGQAKNKSGGE